MKEIIIELEKLSKKALRSGDVPVGAILLKNGKILSRGYNKVEKTGDLTAHAEILAIKSAIKKLKTNNLSECELYVSLEPCIMCKDVICRAKIPKIYYLVAKDAKKAYSPEYCKMKNRQKENEMSLELKKFFMGIREKKR